MKYLEIKKAEDLAGMLSSFSPEHLDDTTLPKFYYNNTMPIRMGNNYSSPLEDLFEDCTMTVGTNAHLLSGHGGCGKSTELVNLKQRLEKDGQPVYLFRSELEMNMYLADCWDIMLFVTEGLCNIAHKHEINLSNATLQAVFDYIKKDMEEVETTETSSTFGIGVVLSFFASIKSNLQFGTKTRTIIKEKMERRASEWLRHIREISDKIAYEMGGKLPILIFEGFDKIQPPERALDIFRHDILTKMPFPIIYTFPIALTYDSRFASIESFYRVHVLPMIKVSNADKTENDDGIEVMRKIVELRADLKLFDKGALDELIKQTGGVLRHLFQCIITASRLARRRGSDKIEMEDSRLALSDLSSMLSKRISDADLDMLARIFNDLNYKKRIEDRESLLKQMHALVVLEYKNGDRWQDLHPLIAEFLIEQGVINVKK